MEETVFSAIETLNYAISADLLGEKVRDAALTLIAYAKANDRPDSIVVGTPSKGGEIKVYFNATDYDQSDALLTTAFLVRRRANELLATEKDLVVPKPKHAIGSGEVHPDAARSYLSSARGKALTEEFRKASGSVPAP